MIVGDDDILGMRAEPVSGAAMEAVRKAGWPQQERYDECRQELDEVNSRLAAREVVDASGGKIVGCNCEAVEENALYGSEDSVLDAVLASESAKVAELVESGRFSWREVDNIVADYAAQALMDDDELVAVAAWNTLLAAKPKVGACAHAAVVTPLAREDGPEAQDEHLAGCSEVVVEDVVRWKAAAEAI